VYSPPSSDTSSISDVTDIRCADFSDAVSSSALSDSASLSVSAGRPGTAGGGEPALLWRVVDDEEDSRFPRSDREREPEADLASGRGVLSDAFSKLSCRCPRDQPVFRVYYNYP